MTVAHLFEIIAQVICRNALHRYAYGCLQVLRARAAPLHSMRELSEFAELARK